MKRILIIDDESSMLAVIEAMLVGENFEVRTFESASAGIEFYQSEGADLVITDIRMKPVDGITVLKTIRTHDPNALVILITAYSNVQDALSAMRMGAYDYLQKPFKMEKLRTIVRRALTMRKVLEKNAQRGRGPAKEVSFCGIMTQNQVMSELFEMIKKVAPSKTTILLQGESGTGKELFARAIQNLSGREKEPFVAINCGALPEHLLESELFGHVKGSFTGAIADKEGLFKTAGEGTLFLDEIASLSMPLQSKLLRVLQEKEIRPVGGTRTEKIHCRVIGATNTPLENLIDSGDFRKDLYYRLSVIPIEIPPLRDRMDDLMLLINHFFEKYAKGRNFQVSPAALSYLYDYHWPGNIRELENTIERATALCSGNVLEIENLPAFIRRDSGFFKFTHGNEVLPLKKFTSVAEGQYILSVIKKFGENKTVAAKHLRIDIATLNRKLERFEKTQKDSGSSGSGS